MTQFKWEKYGNKIHGVSTVIFIVYLVTYFIYVNMKYNMHSYEGEPDKYKPICYVMFICNTWAFVYDLRQFIMAGRLYLFDKWNYVDWVFILTGYYNILAQYDPFDRSFGQDVFQMKIINIIFVIAMLSKSFFFLRMSEDLTKIVIMITNVIGDLKYFLLFYFFIMIMLS